MSENKLSDAQEDMAVDMILNLDTMSSIQKKLGFKTRQLFSKYLADNPIFLQKIEAAKALTCAFLEDELLTCAQDYPKDISRVKMESIARVLKYRDPKKYGDKLDMSVTHTIDIAGSLDKADKRMLDVTPINVVPLLKHDKK